MLLSVKFLLSWKKEEKKIECSSVVLRKWILMSYTLIYSLPESLYQIITLYEGVCVCVRLQWCLSLCSSMDCSSPGSSVHGIFQARIPEWVAISYSRGSSWPRDRTSVLHWQVYPLSLHHLVGCFNPFVE